MVYTLIYIARKIFTSFFVFFRCCNFCISVSYFFRIRIYLPTTKYPFVFYQYFYFILFSFSIFKGITRGISSKSLTVAGSEGGGGAHICFYIFCQKINWCYSFNIFVTYDRIPNFFFLVYFSIFRKRNGIQFIAQ